ncbi:MAG TPA: chemotaxis protein CheB [Roseiflexaceae bacterium]
MPGHDIIVIGASAGGVEALTTLAHGLTPDLPAAVFVVLHIPPESPSLLPQILSRAGPLPTAALNGGTPIRNGQIYVAPPGRHLLIRPGYVHALLGSRENRHRPAIDPLFRSAARAYGPRVVGVVLTGMLDDGTAGLLAIKQRGGVAVVQDPRDALFPGMPRSALANVEVDYTLPLAEIAGLLARLAVEPAAEQASYPVPPEMELGGKIMEQDQAVLQSPERPGTPSEFSCPECGGVLWELHDSSLSRFRCRVGHAFSVESVLAQQNEAIEEALWTALKTLKERAVMSGRLAHNLRERGQHRVAARFEKRGRDAERHAAVILDLLMRDEPAPLDRTTSTWPPTDAGPELPL